MELQQAIQHPTGITVFGSAIVRREPDIASLIIALFRAGCPRTCFLLRGRAVALALPGRAAARTC
jgi:hypothetical protein